MKNKHLKFRWWLLLIKWILNRRLPLRPTSDNIVQQFYIYWSLLLVQKKRENTLKVLIRLLGDNKLLRKNVKSSAKAGSVQKSMIKDCFFSYVNYFYPVYKIFTKSKFFFKKSKTLNIIENHDTKNQTLFLYYKKITRNI